MKTLKPSKLSKIKKRIVENVVNLFEQNLELKDLVGSHVLTGVDRNQLEVDGFEMAECIRFTLDGQTYIVAEDPDDGYRSCMRWIRLSKDKVTNLKSTKVLARMATNRAGDILEILNLKTGKTILEIGTDNSEDYYPFFVSTFEEKNL